MAAGPQHHRRHDDHDRAGAPAREGEGRPARPTARTSTRSRSRCSSSRACSAARRVLHQAAGRDLFPYVRKVITGPDGHIYAWWWSTDLRVLYRRTDLVPKAPRTWDELIAARQGGAEEGPQASTATCSTAGAGRRPRSTTSRYFWLQGGKLLDKQGQAACSPGRQRARRCSTSCASCARRSPPARRRAACDLRHLRRVRRPPPGGHVAMFLGGSFQWPTMQARCPKERSTSGRSPSCRARSRARPRPAPAAGRWPRSARTRRRSPPRMDIVKVDLRRQGQRADGRAADVAAPVRRPQAVPGSRSTRRSASFLEHGEARPGLVDLSVAVERAADRDRQRADRLGDARGRARRRAGDRVEQTYELLTGEMAATAIAAGRAQSAARARGPAFQLPERPVAGAAARRWPRVLPVAVLNVLRLSFTNTTLLRDDYATR